MRCFKLQGQHVMARVLDGQVTELQVGAAVLNRFTRLGTPTTGGEHAVIPPRVWGTTNFADSCNKAILTCLL